MHHSFRCQSNVLRSYGRERSLVFVYSKKQRFEKTLIEVLLPVERRFSVIIEDVLRLRNLIASRFFFAEAKPVWASFSLKS